MELKPSNPQELQQAIAENKAVPAGSAPKAVETPIVIENKKEEPKEPVAEQQKETPKEENKGEKAKRPRLKEAAKPFTLNTEQPVVEVKEDEIPETLKPKFTELSTKLTERENRIAELEAKTNTPTWQLMEEIEKAGQDAFTILNQMKGEDISKLSDKELYQRELLASGVKPSEEAEDGESTLEEEMDKFLSQPKTARDREIAEIRKKYETLESGKQNDFLAKLKAHNETKNNVQAEEKQKLFNAINKYNQDISSLCKAAVGKQHKMVTITPQMAESIENLAKDFDRLLHKNEDGSFSAEVVFDFAFTSLFNDLMLEQMENHFTTQGFEELEREVSVKDGASASIVRTPQGQTSLTGKDLRQHLHNNLQPVS